MRTLDTGPVGRGGWTLLLVHGWGSDAEDWRPLLPRLTRWARVVAPDLPGHGRPGTRLGRGPLTPVALADRLAALLRGLGTGPVVAVGHSLGGQLVSALAVAHPELVRGVVVLAPAYGGDPADRPRIRAEQRELRRRGSGWAVDFVAGAFGPSAPEGLRDRHRRLMARMSPEVLARYRHGLYLAPGAFGLRPATEALLRRRRCPVLAVHNVPAAAAWERGLSRHPASRVELWPRCGHYLHEERPGALARTLADWCATLPPVG
ncbi:alpha/beta fold hydrolase [Streptomyces sp. NBRC 109706]|uniref:alpha/beta fold hydrolase n=1 Tax=Streptomyces sp. NBRC 109706 TaxID=1550035 RepID=UPI0008332C40|nr:alpha/beta hydrolase [Streptomyces sp. NBRC 109706]